MGWIVREPGPPPYFSLYDDDAKLLGRAKHVMVALGHGPLAFPGVYGEARKQTRSWPTGSCRRTSRSSTTQGGRYIVLGSGIASVNEWVNVIDAGAQCIALRRNPEPDEQDLNVPRCLFDGSGIDAFQGLSFDQRVDFLGRALRGTAPESGDWAAKVRAGRGRGRFEEAIGEVTEIRPGPAGLRARPEAPRRLRVRARPDRDRLRNRVRQVRPRAAPAAPPGADLRRTGRARADQAEDELRRAAPGPR